MPFQVERTQKQQMELNVGCLIKLRCCKRCPAAALSMRSFETAIWYHSESKRSPSMPLSGLFPCSQGIPSRPQISPPLSPHQHVVS